MVDRRSTFHKIQKRVLNFPIGSVFALCDFLDLADDDTISKALARLCTAEVLHRVFRGIYWRPDGIHEEPDPDDVAHAIARSNAWKVVPEGETALIITGLQKRDTSIWTYVTTGTTREYTYGNSRIVFKHRTDGQIREISPKTGMLVQILKAYGKDNITPEILMDLRTVFGPENDEVLIQDISLIPRWMAAVVKRLCQINTQSNVVGGPVYPQED